MPCSDNWDTCPRSEDSSLRKENNELNEMLCSTCRVLEKDGFDFDTNPLLSRWWDNHKKEDAAKEVVRIRKQKRHEMAMEVAKKPFAILTKEDKKLLREVGML